MIGSCCLVNATTATAEAFALCGENGTGVKGIISCCAVHPHTCSSSSFWKVIFCSNGSPWIEKVRQEGIKGFSIPQNEEAAEWGQEIWEVSVCSPFFGERDHSSVGFVDGARCGRGLTAVLRNWMVLFFSCLMSRESALSPWMPVGEGSSKQNRPGNVSPEDKKRRTLIARRLTGGGGKGSTGWANNRVPPGGAKLPRKPQQPKAPIRAWGGESRKGSLSGSSGRSEGWVVCQDILSCNSSFVSALPHCEGVGSLS